MPAGSWSNATPHSITGPAHYSKCCGDIRNISSSCPDMDWSVASIRSLYDINDNSRVPGGRVPCPQEQFKLVLNPKLDHALRDFNWRTVLQGVKTAQRVHYGVLVTGNIPVPTARASSPFVTSSGTASLSAFYGTGHNTFVTKCSVPVLSFLGHAYCTGRA